MMHKTQKDVMYTAYKNSMEDYHGMLWVQKNPRCKKNYQLNIQLYWYVTLIYLIDDVQKYIKKKDDRRYLNMQI